MKKWLLFVSPSLIISGIGLLIFCINSTPAQAGLSVSATVTICGNATVDGPEQCDGVNLNGQNCIDRGYTGGSLSCNVNCTFNVSACTSDGGGGGGGGGGGYVPPVVTKVILVGKAYPEAEITVLTDGSVSTILTADSDATFKAELSDLTSGVYNFGIWADDVEGRRSITFSFTITVADGVQTTISNIFLPPTIELSKVNLSKGESLEILGKSASEADIVIHVESTEIIEKTKAEETGDWKYILDTNVLEEGSHTARAKAEDQDGSISSFSKVLGFSVGKYSVVEICPRADFDNNAKTNLVDFSILLYWWGKYNPCVDQNQDGMVNLADFSILMYWWTG